MRTGPRVFELIFGLCVVALCFLTYIRGRRYELTFISNMALGLACVTDAILSLARNGKGLRAFVWHLVLSAHLPVIICVFLGFSLSGSFVFLHLVNPVLLFWIYLLVARPSIDKKSARLACVFGGPASFLAYALFDLVRYFFTGSFVYGVFVTPDRLTPGFIAAAGLVIYIGLVCMNAALIGLRLAFIRKRKKNLPDDGLLAE